MTANEQFPLHVKDCGISPSQLRAARGMIDWSRGELAKEAGLSAETIKNIEHGVYSPKEETIKTLMEVFARRGIRFVQYEATISYDIGHRKIENPLIVSHAGVVSIAVIAPESAEEGHD